MEGAAHGSNDGGGNCTWKLDLQTRPSTVEETSVLCIDDGGSSRGSDDGEGSGCTRSRVYGLGSRGGQGLCAHV